MRVLQGIAGNNKGGFEVEYTWRRKLEYAFDTCHVFGFLFYNLYYLLESQQNITNKSEICCYPQKRCILLPRR
jgi:hypothetical protein